MHRLIQAVVRNRLTRQKRDAWVEVAVSVLHEAFPTQLDDPSTWPRCDQLIPHVLAVADHAQAAGAATDPTADVLEAAGSYLWRRGELRAARKLLERALVLAEATHGLDHLEVNRLHNQLGVVLHDLGEFAGARTHLERALAIDEATHGPDDPALAATLSNLGGVLRDLNDLAGARFLLERSLAISEAAYGSNDPDVAIIRDILGGVLYAQGDHAGARSHHERALAILKAALGRVSKVMATR